MSSAASIWLRYENEDSAFALMGGYSRLNFVADLAGLKAVYTAYADAETALGLIRVGDAVQVTVHVSLRRA